MIENFIIDSEAADHNPEYLITAIYTKEYCLESALVDSLDYTLTEIVNCTE